MLESMRQNTKSLQPFLWLVVVAFVGVPVITAIRGSLDKAGSKNAAALVNGTAVSFTSLEQEYRRLYNFYKQFYGDNLTRDVLNNLQLEKIALNQLVQSALLVQEAEKYHLRVSADELVTMIRDIPDFQTDGLFDPEVYKTLLARARLTPQDFETRVTEDLLTQKIEYLIKHTVQISDREVRQEYIAENEQVKVEGIWMNPVQFIEKVEMTDDEVASYYESHKETFQTPPRLKVRYIVFKPEALMDEITISEEDNRQYYEANKSEFDKGKEVNARHILLRLEEDADEETEASIKELGEEILLLAKDGTDFSFLAETYSDDPGSAENGGDLGFFSKGMMVPEFETAAFALEPGQVSDLVKTQFGYHIIKVEEVREEADPYAKAKPIIEDRLKLEQAKMLAAARAEDAYEEVLSIRNFEQIAEKNDLQVAVSRFFARGESLDENTPVLRQVEELAFTLNTDERFSQPIETFSGYYLLEFWETKAPYIPELEEIAEDVPEALRQEKAKELASAEIRKIEEELKAGIAWENVVEKYALETFSPEPFDRRERYISEVQGDIEEFVKIAFSLEEQAYSSVIDLAEKYCVIRLVEKIAIDETTFEGEKDSLKKELLRQKQNIVFEEFIEDLQQKADIRYSELLEG